MSDTPTPNRRARRAEAATAPVKPAIAASAERAAIERDPDVGDAAMLAPGDAVTAPAADLPGAETAVLPEPTLVAEPGKPVPIVTASPPLAIEPGAVDVVQAEVAADRVAAGSEPLADREGPNFAAAGQPVLTIEGNGAKLSGELSHSGIETGRVRFEDIAVVGPRDIDRLYDRSLIGQGSDVLSHDDLTAQLEHLWMVDPVAFEEIRVRVFGRDGQPASLSAEPLVPTVRVIKVVGPQQGRRRAGNSFGPQPRHFTDGELTEAEIAALEADPLLSVSISQVRADEVAALFG